MRLFFILNAPSSILYQVSGIVAEVYVVFCSVWLGDCRDTSLHIPQFISLDYLLSQIYISYSFG